MIAYEQEFLRSSLARGFQLFSKETQLFSLSSKGHAARNKQSALAPVTRSRRLECLPILRIPHLANFLYFNRFGSTASGPSRLILSAS